MTKRTRKESDVSTGTANVIVSGSELRQMRAEDLARWKRRVSRKLQAQKYRTIEDRPIEERKDLQTWNDAFDVALKIINAKWKNL